ncbi:hypothetical protein ACE14D_04455, partial [Streptomyces sp. Act-28]
MSFGGPQWPQEPHQPDGGSGHDPYGGRQYGGGPQGAPHDQGQGQAPHGQPFGGPPASPFGARPASPFGVRDDGTPDWSALAEASEARQRRRRWLVAGGGVLA